MKKGYLYIILSAIFFSTMEVALKLVSHSFNPVQISFLRFTTGSIVLLPLALRSLKNRGIVPDKDDIKSFALTGFICVIVSMTLYQMSILYAKASVVAVLFSCNPVFVIPLAFLILKEKIGKNAVFSMIISLIGILFIMNPFNMKSAATGIILTILAAVTFALYGVIGKRESEKYGAVALTCFSFMLGCFELFLLIMLSRIGFISNFLTGAGLQIFANIPIFQGIDMHHLPGLIYIGVFVTGFGYMFYFLSMQETSASTASVVFFIKPALAPILAFIILHESIALNTVAGIILIITGSSLTLMFNGKKDEVLYSQPLQSENPSANATA